MVECLQVITFICKENNELYYDNINLEELHTK
jgi:hypothetical protein